MYTKNFVINILLIDDNLINREERRFTTKFS